MRLTEHALVVYLYATVVGEDVDRADAGYQQLGRAWGQLAQRLQLTAPADGAPSADPDPHRPDTTRSQLLAGRTTPDPVAGGVRQMWCDQVHDVVCLSVALTSTGPDWTGLYDEWTQAMAGLELGDLLAVVEVFTASTGHADPVLPDDRTAALVRDALPASVKPGPRWQTTSAATPGGLALFELSTSDEPRPSRRSLAVIAPTGPAGDAELNAWVWQAGLGRLAMYLLNDAKLRHQAYVVRRDRPAIADLRRQALRALTDLQPLITNPTSYTPTQLRAEHTKLNNLQAKSNGLIDALARISIVRRTIAIAADNMAELTRGHVDPHHTAFFDAQQRLAQRLDRELDDEHTYLTAARDRLHHYATVAAETLNHHRQQTQQANQHRENQFILFQTAIIGAILMALTAVQAFNYRLDIPEPAQPAAIAALGFFALLLYTYALRRAELTQRPDQPPPLWITTVISLTAGASAASVILTILTLWPLSLRLPTLTTTTYVATTLTFAVATTVTALTLHRRRT